jgi:anti-sigma regulatory factor (Ser/Thr protein kinase)
MTPRGTDFLMPEVAALVAPPVAAVGSVGVAAGGFRPVCRVFAGQPGQVVQARRFVRRVLAAGVLRDGRAAGVLSDGQATGVLTDGLAADAVLLTSELAANAIQHTASGQGGTFAVTICPRPPAIRICVTDGGAPAGPSITSPVSLAASGRGLAIVDTLASRWGHHAGPGGRTVWFELSTEE